ncbi:MAG: hypothetical protein ACE5HE_01030, partial [Phycisphaerae bacterium]
MRLATRCAVRCPATWLVLVCCLSRGEAAPTRDARRETSIRAGSGRKIVAVEPGPGSTARPALRTTALYPHPRPRLAGFSPLVAIATSNEGHPLGYDLEFEHDLQSTYVGSPLNPFANPGFVIGILDTGADSDLVAGAAADTLGLVGRNLTANSIPIGGAGGTISAAITMPVGFFAAGLSAVYAEDMLDYTALVGHSNVCGLAAPEIQCGGEEALTAVVGLPFLAFYNSIIRVDTPRAVRVGGTTYMGPDVQIQPVFQPIPHYAHRISIEFGGLSPLATTANYYVDFFDLETPIIPTLLSFLPGTIPFGGAFFATIHLREGDQTEPLVSLRVLV